MNKKIIALKQKRADKLAELKAITAKAENEKRYKSTEELEKWNTLKSEIDEMNSEIETLVEEERMDAGTAALGVQNDQEDAEQKEAKRYNLSKAITEKAEGRGLTGFEKEIQDEGEKEYRRMGQSAKGIVIPAKVMRSLSVANNSQHISEVAQGIDIIADRSVLAQLGVTTFEGLTSQLKMSFSDGMEATFLGEEVAATEAAYAQQDGKIEARRIQGWKAFHNEYLAQSATMPELMADMVRSTDAAAAKELFNAILALPALAGYDPAADAAKQLTWADVMKLKGAQKTANFVRPKYLAGGELFASLEATAKDAGSGRYILEGNKISAYDAVDAQGLIAPVADTALDTDTDPTYALIFGDFARAYVGYYSGIEILVDPFTYSNTGKTKLTWHRLGDVEVNPMAFKAIKNALL
jgi:HK97 family phage major capsid protein